MPRIEVMRVVKVMAHGLRSRGRRPMKRDSWSLSISLAGAPLAGKRAGEEVECAVREGLSIDASRSSEGFQLTLLERLLRAGPDRLSELRRRSRLEGDGLVGADARESSARGVRSELT